MSFSITLDESIKWTIGGQDYEVKKPTVKQIAAFSEKAKAAPSEDVLAQLEVTQTFLADQGLPVELTDKFTPEQLQSVVQSLVEPKKKA